MSVNGRRTTTRRASCWRWWASSARWPRSCMTSARVLRRRAGARGG